MNNENLLPELITSERLIIRVAKPGGWRDVQ